MAYVQTANGTGTTTASATLNGVAAGSALIAFGWVGSTSSPTAHSVSDAQGAYTIQGSAVIDSVNAIWCQAFILANANAGSHTATFTSDSGASVQVNLIECTAPASSPVLGTNGAFDGNPGTGANALTTGSVPAASSGTLLGICTDTGNVNATDEPAVGTGFTSRDAGANGTIGSWRLESKAVSSATAATFTAIAGASRFVMQGIAIAEPSGGATNTKVMSDTLVVPDSDVLIRRFRRQLEDDLLITDGFVKSIIGGGGTVNTKVMTETLIISEPTLDRALIMDIAESLIVSDDAGQRWIMRRAMLSDSFALSDGFIKAFVLRRQMEDDLTLTDGFVLIRRYRRTLEDDLVLTDNQSHSIGGGAGTIYGKIMEDDLLLVDDASQRYWFRVRALSDSVAFTDAQLSHAQRTRFMEDDLTLVDSLPLIRWRHVTVEDDLTIADEKISTFLPSMTFDVRVRIGIEAGPQLNASSEIRLGGY